MIYISEQFICLIGFPICIIFCLFFCNSEEDFCIHYCYFPKNVKHYNANSGKNMGTLHINKSVFWWWNFDVRWWNSAIVYLPLLHCSSNLPCGRNLPFPVAILSISGIMQVCAMVRLGIEGLSVNLFLGMVISNFQCAEMLLTSLRLERSAAGML